MRSAALLNDWILERRFQPWGLSLKSAVLWCSSVSYLARMLSHSRVLFNDSLNCFTGITYKPRAILNERLEYSLRSRFLKWWFPVQPKPDGLNKGGGSESHVEQLWWVRNTERVPCTATHIRRLLQILLLRWGNRGKLRPKCSKVI